MRAVSTGECISCGKPIEPWRRAEGHCRCALCCRTAKSQDRRCSRCAQLGHTAASCQEPPHDYEGPFHNAQGQERYQLHRPMTEAEKDVHRLLLDDLETEIARLTAKVARQRYQLEHEVLIVRYAAPPDERRQQSSTSEESPAAIAGR